MSTSMRCRISPPVHALQNKQRFSLARSQRLTDCTLKEFMARTAIAGKSSLFFCSHRFLRRRRLVAATHVASWLRTHAKRTANGIRPPFFYVSVIEGDGSSRPATTSEAKHAWSELPARREPDARCKTVLSPRGLHFDHERAMMIDTSSQLGMFLWFADFSCPSRF